jgi:putative ribosome biogenesis GTPase RsgA
LQEWIPGLASRKKWNKTTRNFTVGDVVIVMNTETACGQWPLGRIIEVLPGKDGLIRVVKVQVGKTVFTCSINYLCPLEVAQD